MHYFVLWWPRVIVYNIEVINFNGLSYFINIEDVVSTSVVQDMAIVMFGQITPETFSRSHHEYQCLEDAHTETSSSGFGHR